MWAPNIKHQEIIATLQTMPLWFCHDEQQNSIQNLFPLWCFCHSICQLYGKEKLHLPAFAGSNTGKESWELYLYVLGSCYFQHCPPGVTGTDSDHLKDTQEADATDGPSPPHSAERRKLCSQNHCGYASIQRLPLSRGPLYRGGSRRWPQSGA